MFSTTDTIVAIATPAGHGGIGVVRLSGAEAVQIAGVLTARSEPYEPRVATRAAVHDRARPGGVIDQVVVTWFRGPASYTGEDVVEIGAHGSPVVLRAIVEQAIAAGARLAEPGEFTLRAYLHERIDLVQAEAVADLIDAVTPLQARAAADQLEGTLTGVIGAIDEALFDLVARLEASLDFPEEGFHFVTREAIVGELTAVLERLDDLAREGRRGRMIREGATVVIAGRPNAGKSSLFNALAGADRAIVTHVAGTTRDVLTERVDIEGVPVSLVDTAGLRDTEDAVEVEGVRRARAAQDVARLVLMLVDGSSPPTDEEWEWLRSPAANRLVVISKGDLRPAWNAGEGATACVPVSARTGAGLDMLRRRIVEALTGDETRADTPTMSNVRHLGLVDAARAAVRRGVAVLTDGATEELVLAELGAAREALEAIVGRRTADDVLRHIFSRFCIGK